MYALYNLLKQQEVTTGVLDTVLYIVALLLLTQRGNKCLAEHIDEGIMDYVLVHQGVGFHYPSSFAKPSALDKKRGDTDNNIHSEEEEDQKEQMELRLPLYELMPLGQGGVMTILQRLASEKECCQYYCLLCSSLRSPGVHWLLLWLVEEQPYVLDEEQPYVLELLNESEGKKR